MLISGKFDLPVKLVWQNFVWFIDFRYCKFIDRICATSRYCCLSHRPSRHLHAAIHLSSQSIVVIQPTIQRLAPGPNFPANQIRPACCLLYCPADGMRAYLIDVLAAARNLLVTVLLKLAIFIYLFWIYFELTNFDFEFCGFCNVNADFAVLFDFGNWRQIADLKIVLLCWTISATVFWLCANLNLFYLLLYLTAIWILVFEFWRSWYL